MFGYDEQYLKVNSNERVRLALLDLNTCIVINRWTVDEFNQEIFETFLKVSLEGLTVKTIVTDGYVAYGQVLDAMKCEHHLCTFHIMQDLMIDAIKVINKNRRKIKTLKKVIDKNKTKIKRLKTSKAKKAVYKKIRELKKELRSYKRKQKEWENTIERISNIFKADTPQKAKRRFNIFFNNIKNLNPIIAKFISNLKHKFEKTINHIGRDDIPPTNNILERFFGITIPQNLKRRFRTDKGLEIHQYLTEYRWIKRNHKTNKIKKSVTF